MHLKVCSNTPSTLPSSTMHTVQHCPYRTKCTNTIGTNSDGKNSNTKIMFHCINRIQPQNKPITTCASCNGELLDS